MLRRPKADATDYTRKKNEKMENSTKKVDMRGEVGIYSEALDVFYIMSN